MQSARQHCTKREGCLAKRYVEEVAAKAQPLFEEGRFQGLAPVVAFQEEWQQLLREDVDRIILDRRVEELCREYHQVPLSLPAT